MVLLPLLVASTSIEPYPPEIPDTRPIYDIDRWQTATPDTFSILCVSKQFHAVGEHILYRRNTFRFKMARELSSFLDQASERARRYLSAIRIELSRESHEDKPMLDLLC